MTAVINVDDALRALAATTQIDDVKRIRNEAEALRTYAKRARLSKEAQNRAAELRLRAERRCGELLIYQAGNGTRAKGRPSKLSASSTLSDLNITRDESAQWQRIAKMEPNDFEAYINARVSAGDELTTAGILSYARMAVHYSQDSVEWYTPAGIIEKVVATLGHIDVDPCAESHRVKNIPAKTHYTEKQDGLSRPWPGRVFVNPPYNDIGTWAEKLREEFDAERTEMALVLGPARTDRPWFRLLAEESPFCLVTGRLRFTGPEYDGNTAPFPSAMFSLGVPRDTFIEVWRDTGLIYERVV